MFGLLFDAYLFNWYLNMMLLILCFIIHVSTSPKIQIFVAIDYPYKYSLSFNLLSSSSFNSLSIPFNIDICVSSNDMASVFFFFFDLFDFCLGFLLLIIYLIYWFHFIKFLLSNLIFLSIFMTAFFMITPVETSEILSGMLRLVFLGFRYAWSQNKKEHALSSLLALYTTADNAPDLLTFFSSSLHFKYPLLNLSKKFRAVSPKITKNKEDLICAPTSLPFWTQADSYWHLLKLDQQLFTE